MTAMPRFSADPDVFSRMALGALRFVDAVTGLSINEGLSVMARVRNRTISAVPSPRGVHLFHQLPGLSIVSFWDGVAEPKPQPLAYEFNIEVRDTSRRFFPTAFKTSFSAWPEAVPICADLAALANKVPLYSTPWRLPRNDFAIIRGTLRVLSSDKPAAWALLRVYRKDDDVATATAVIEGVAGPDGEFMLMFPWPKADTSALSGPKGPHWTMRIQAWYDSPDPQISSDDLPDGEKRLPKLCSILKQRRAKLLAASDSNAELPLQEMIPGQTLLLKTSEIPPPGMPEKKILYLETT